MVCPRCITAVENVLQEMKIPSKKIDLGQVEIVQELSDSLRDQLSENLSNLEFKLIM